MNNKVICFGEIMLRLATPDHNRFNQSDKFYASFGGGEANVAVSLANYNIPVSFVSRMPVNSISDSCISRLRGLGVDTSHMAYGGSRIGLYYLETGAVNRATKVIYDREGSAFSEIMPGMIDWEKVLHKATWFHWTGITPAISESAATICKEAITVANKKGITVSTDLNFRKNLWK